MPKQIQNPELTQQLVSSFDLKGRASFVLDETVVPVVIAADIVQHPRQSSGTRFRSQGAVALENAFVGVRPGEGQILKVLGYEINSSNGAAITDYSVRIVTDADFLTLSAAIIATGGLFLTNRERPPAILGAMPETESQMFHGTRVGELGDDLARPFVAPDTTLVSSFPSPPLLFGGTLSLAAAVSTNVPTAIVVWNRTLNQACAVAFHVEEQGIA